jgi:hypothetical protein
MFERSGLRDLDVVPAGVAVETVARATYVEIPSRVAMLVQLDVARTTHVHIVHAVVQRQDTLKRSPVGLSDRDGYLSVGIMGSLHLQSVTLRHEYAGSQCSRRPW